MNRFMLGATAFITLVVGVAIYETRAVTASSAEWPMSRIEIMAAQGHLGQLNTIREAIAHVASGDETKAKQIGEIAMAWGALRADAEDFAREAARSRHLDVALVQSGASWVQRK